MLTSLGSNTNMSQLMKVFDVLDCPSLLKQLATEARISLKLWLHLSTMMHHPQIDHRVLDWSCPEKGVSHRPQDRPICHIPPYVQRSPFPSQRSLFGV